MTDVPRPLAAPRRGSFVLGLVVGLLIGLVLALDRKSTRLNSSQTCALPI